MSRTHKATPMDDNGVVTCYKHGLRASLRTSNTTNNPGRAFYCCSKDMNDTDRCNFFHWTDDPMFKRRETPSSQATSPSSSQLPIPGTQVSTPPTTPSLKRSYDASTASQQPPMTPSQKRLKIMEDALSNIPTQRNPASNQRLPSTPGSKRQRLSQIETALSSSSKNPRTLQDHETPSKTNYYDPEIQPLPRKTAQNPIPHSDRTVLSPIEETSGHQVETKSETDEDAKLWALVTPSSSFQELEPPPEERGNNVGPTISSSRKGKERAKENGIRWRSNDSENPFEESASNASSLNPRPSNSTDFSADLISSLLNNLSVIPDYLRRLERQKVAAEKSNHAKANRIFELEEEVARLKLNKQELEETIKTLESRCRRIS